MMYVLAGFALVVVILVAVGYSAWKDFNDPHH